MAITVEKALNRMQEELSSAFPQPDSQLEKAVQNFTRHQKALQDVIAQARQMALSQEQARQLFDKFSAQRQMLAIGLIQVKARYAGDPKLSTLSQLLAKIIKGLDDVLICLQVLLDAYEGYAAPVPKTLGPAWEKVLDHVLLYHELQTRMKESRKRISLDELRRRYEL